MSGLTNTVSICKISTANISFVVFNQRCSGDALCVYTVAILNFYIDPSICVVCADLAVMVTDGLLLYFAADSL